MTQEIQRFSSLRTRLLGMTALAGLCAAVTLPADDAHAAGYALKEQSAAAQGNSFAGATAGAEDITYMFFNPAGLTRQEGHQVGVVISYISPQADTDNATGGLGGEISASAGDPAVVPAAYAMWSVTPELKLALAINVPFGLATEYTDTWAGRFHAIESELKTLNINPVVAYRFNEMISVGAGFQAQHIEATLSNAIDADFDLGNGLQEVVGEMEGDDWGYGFNLGMMVEFSEATRLGLGYRSKIDSTLAGDITVNGSFADTVTADLTTPASATIGLYHDINEQWAIMGEIGWTGWSSFDEIRVQFDNLPLADSVTPEDWDDVWFFAAGVTWRPTAEWTIRGGLAFDQSPIPNATRTPRIPGADRTWLSVGARYELSPTFAIDAGYTHIFVDDSTVDLAGGTPLAFTANYENSVDILALQGTFRF
ncbi:MAG: porin [Alphaproteobacteria bacterium]|nr:porin [Alphaproteobacteria bacterium]